MGSYFLQQEFLKCFVNQIPKKYKTFFKVISSLIECGWVFTPPLDAKVPMNISAPSPKRGHGPSSPPP